MSDDYRARSETSASGPDGGITGPVLAGHLHPKNGMTRPPSGRDGGLMTESYDLIVESGSWPDVNVRYPKRWLLEGSQRLDPGPAPARAVS